MRSHPVPKVGDTVRFNDFGLEQVFGRTLGLAHMKTRDLRITFVDATSMTEPEETFVVEVDDPDINTFLLSHWHFDIVPEVAQAPAAATMAELYALVDRFQALKEKTGTNKDSSYRISVGFGPWEPQVSIEWGTYDIGDYPRHYSTECPRNTLLAHLAQEIAKMEQVVADEAPGD